MAVGYRNSAGFDFDLLFQPGDTQAPGFRRSDGSNLRYAPRGATAKIPDVGFRDSFGVDLSNLWMALQMAPPVPGFDGGNYQVGAIAPTGASGNTSATIRLTMRSDGVWEVVGTRTNAVGAGTVVLASGVWLPAGSVASDFTVRYAANAGTGQGSISNGAVSAVSLATSRSFSIFVEVPAVSSTIQEDERILTATLTRVGSGSSTAVCRLGASAAGFL